MEQVRHVGVTSFDHHSKVREEIPLTGAVFRIAQILILPALVQLLDVTLPMALDENVPGRITVSSVPVIVCRGLPDYMGSDPPFLDSFVQDVTSSSSRISTLVHSDSQI